MKYIFLLPCFVVIIFSSCLDLSFSYQNNNELESFISRNNTLIPFAKNGKLGYIDSETLKIVISEQYVSAKSFVGNFAVVEEHEGKPYIINKNNEKILGKFDHITLFDTENGEIVFALTGKNTGYAFERYDIRWFWDVWYWEPSRINYRLYNLNTGKMVMKLGELPHPTIDDDKPRIRIFDNFMTYEISSGDSFSIRRDAKYVCEIQNNGGIRKSEMSFDDLIVKIVKEHNLQYKENDFYYNHDPYDFTYYYQGKLSDWLGYFFNFDIDRLIEHLPDNLGVVRREYNSHYKDYVRDGKYVNEKYTLEIGLIGDITYPLKDKFLFQVHLRTNENGERFVSGSDGERFTGLFNASENRWEILPIKGQEIFFYGANNDWIIYGDGQAFYNIKTRKKYINTYKILNYTPNLLSSPMAYTGYSEWAKNLLVEDF